MAQNGLLAAFAHLDAATDAIGELKQNGYKGMTVYSPAPMHELEHAVDNKLSPVGYWTLGGALTGCLSGLAMTMWMSYDYPLVTGGKPLGSVLPYVVIMFELTILLGALSTLAGLAVHTIMTNQKAPFDGRFSDDHIGVYVECDSDKHAAVEQLLRTAGAVEVKHA